MSDALSNRLPVNQTTHRVANHNVTFGQVNVKVTSDKTWTPRVAGSGVGSLAQGTGASGIWGTLCGIGRAIKQTLSVAWHSISAHASRQPLPAPDTHNYRVVSQVLGAPPRVGQALQAQQPVAGRDAAVALEAHMQARAVARARVDSFLGSAPAPANAVLAAFQENLRAGFQKFAAAETAEAPAADRRGRSASAVFTAAVQPGGIADAEGRPRSASRVLSATEAATIKDQLATIVQRYEAHLKGEQLDLGMLLMTLSLSREVAPLITRDGWTDRGFATLQAQLHLLAEPGLAGAENLRRACGAGTQFDGLIASLRSAAYQEQELDMQEQLGLLPQGMRHDPQVQDNAKRVAELRSRQAALYDEIDRGLKKTGAKNEAALDARDYGNLANVALTPLVMKALRKDGLVTMPKIAEVAVLLGGVAVLEQKIVEARAKPDLGTARRGLENTVVNLQADLATSVAVVRGGLPLLGNLPSAEAQALRQQVDQAVGTIDQLLERTRQAAAAGHKPPRIDLAWQEAIKGLRASTDKLEAEAKRLADADPHKGPLALAASRLKAFQDIAARGYVVLFPLALHIRAHTERAYVEMALLENAKRVSVGSDAQALQERLATLRQTFGDRSGEDIELLAPHLPAENDDPATTHRKMATLDTIERKLHGRTLLMSSAAAQNAVRDLARIQTAPAQGPSELGREPDHAALTDGRTSGPIAIDRGKLLDVANKRVADLVALYAADDPRAPGGRVGLTAGELKKLGLDKDRAEFIDAFVANLARCQVRSLADVQEISEVVQGVSTGLGGSQGDVQKLMKQHLALRSDGVAPETDSLQTNLERMEVGAKVSIEHAVQVTGGVKAGLNEDVFVGKREDESQPKPFEAGVTFAGTAKAKGIWSSAAETARTKDGFELTFEDAWKAGGKFAFDAKVEGRWNKDEKHIYGSVGAGATVSGEAQHGRATAVMLAVQDKTDSDRQATVMERFQPLITSLGTRQSVPEILSKVDQITVSKSSQTTRKLGGNLAIAGTYAVGEDNAAGGGVTGNKIYSRATKTATAIEGGKRTVTTTKTVISQGSFSIQGRGNISKPVPGGIDGTTDLTSSYEPRISKQKVAYAADGLIGGGTSNTEIRYIKDKAAAEKVLTEFAPNNDPAALDDYNLAKGQALAKVIDGGSIGIVTSLKEAVRKEINQLLMLAQAVEKGSLPHETVPVALLQADVGSRAQDTKLGSAAGVAASLREKADALRADTMSFEVSRILVGLPQDMQASSSAVEVGVNFSHPLTFIAKLTASLAAQWDDTATTQIGHEVKIEKGAAEKQNAARLQAQQQEAEHLQPEHPAGDEDQEQADMSQEEEVWLHRIDTKIFG